VYRSAHHYRHLDVKYDYLDSKDCSEKDDVRERIKHSGNVNMHRVDGSKVDCNIGTCRSPWPTLVFYINHCTYVSVGKAKRKAF
jgi:hypothetical protein